MAEGLKRAFEFSRRTRDRFVIGGLEFTVCHEGHGKWTASVRSLHGELTTGYVKYPLGGTVVQPNRDALIKYIRYAYQGQET